MTMQQSKDFRRADFIGADLSAANINRADLTGAHWDKNTIWPDGIGPLNDQPKES